MKKLLTSLNLGALNLTHRIVVRAEHGAASDPVQRHRRYASWATPGGLIIAADFDISRQGSGWPPAPRLDGPLALRSWRETVAAVHDTGGMIVAPLRHMGRLAHSSIGGEGPVAPSRVASRRSVFDAEGTAVRAEEPWPLDQAGIDRVLDDYSAAAASARSLGFDGVELLASDALLPDQFLQNRINTRIDRYGGNIENRMCFLLEVVQRLIDIFGVQRVGVRLTPAGGEHPVEDSDPTGLYQRALRELFELDLAYAHLKLPATISLRHQLAPLRAAFPSPILLSAAIPLAQAYELIQSRIVDAVSVGHGHASMASLQWLR